MSYSLEDLFNNTQNYNAITFDLFIKDSEGYLLSKESFNEATELLGFGISRIETRCDVCDKRYPFIVKVSSLSNNSAYFSFVNTPAFDDVIMYFDGRSSLSENTFKKYQLTHFIVYLEYVLTCANCNRVYRMFLRVEFSNGKLFVQKIGQYPSQIDVEGYDFDKYKSILNRFNAYNDYKKSHLSYSEGFYVGSFAYLRRVFEKMLIDYIDGVELDDHHVETKIKVAKAKFSPDIVDMLKPLYELLSISIHELDENESKDYYEYLVAVIELQLEYEKSIADKEKALKHLSSKITKFKSDIRLNRGKNNE